MAEERALQAMIMSIVIVGILLVIGIYINATIETTVDASGTTGTVPNETLTTVEENGETFSVFGWRDVSCGTAIVTNSTDGEIIESANYTQTGCSIAYLNASDFRFNNTDWNVSYGYTYSADTNASVAARDSVAALGSGTPWLTIIVVIAFAVVVLGMLTSGFRREGAQPQLTY